MLPHTPAGNAQPNTTEVLTCDLYEPDGRPLGRGTCRVHAEPDGTCTVTAVLNQPGHIVTRALLGPVEDVQLQLPGAVLLPAHIEDIFFDPHQGRTCLLRVVDSL